MTIYRVLSFWRKQHYALSENGSFLCGRLHPGCRLDYPSAARALESASPHACKACIKHLRAVAESEAEPSHKQPK